MIKKVGAVSIGVIIGLVVAFARAGAFQLWGSDSPQAQSSPATQSAQADQTKPPANNPMPAPANQPEPNEKVGVITSFAPLVKHVMPTVVNVAVVQEVKVGMQGGSPDEGGGAPDEGGPDAGPPMQQQEPGMPPGGGGGGGADPFEQFRRFFGQQPHDYKQHGLGSGVIVSADG